MNLPINVSDYEALAQAALPPVNWDFFYGGSDDEVTLRANRSAFERIRLRTRVLMDVNRCDISTSVLGLPVSMPILLAPSAAHGLAHPDAELATARAAGAANTLMTLSTDSTRSLEEVRAVAQGPLWYQLYIYTMEEAQGLVQRAERAGYAAIVLTVDLPRYSRRERDLRNDMNSYQQAHYPSVFNGNAPHLVVDGSDNQHIYMGDAVTEDILPWLRSITSLPIVLKGILTAEDAEAAIKYGASAIIVSNHGGRQLDGVMPTIEALPEVVAAVDGRCEVYMDGGIRRGTDILKALALGARAVMIGRPVLWGLAVNGQEGVQHVLELLRKELMLTLQLSGCASLADIQRSLVQLP
jgi:isopentenyl diphosphate isomerase/L-lactate dehydrogenase-like FMN-dependent dehydrogenase